MKKEKKSKKMYIVALILAAVYFIYSFTLFQGHIVWGIISLCLSSLLGIGGYAGYKKAKNGTTDSDPMTIVANDKVAQKLGQSKTFHKNNIVIDTKDHVLDYTIKSYRVAGANHYKKNIMEVAYENDDYSMTKKQIVDAGMEDEKIWKYEVSNLNANLVPEPDNKHDPNAIMVIVDGLLVGYVEAVSCMHLLDLISDNRILDITAEICGGPYKIVTEDCYNYDTGKETYSLERGSYDFAIELTIKEKKKSQCVQIGHNNTTTDRR